MNLQIGVKLLVKNAKGQYLLLRRAGHESLNDVWDIPGGRIEPSETLAAALVREVKEEIGVDISGQPQLIAAQDIFPANADVHVIRLTYLVVEDVTIGSLSEEHSEARYFECASARDLSIDPLLMDVLKDIENVK